MRYDKSDTILAKNLKLDSLNDKLNEILKRIELFIKYNGYYPKQLLIDYITYEEIYTNRKDLLMVFDSQTYLLNLKIVF